MSLTLCQCYCLQSSSLHCRQISWSREIENRTFLWIVLRTGLDSHSVSDCILQTYAALNFNLYKTHLALCHKQSSLKQMKCIRELSIEQGVLLKSLWPLYFFSPYELMVSFWALRRVPIRVSSSSLGSNLITTVFYLKKEIHNIER